MTDAAKIDPLKLAAGIAHGAAVNAMLAFGATEEAAEWWSNAGAPGSGDPFDVADRLAATFCSERELGGSSPPLRITGERVWREAAELHLHGLGGNAWPQQDVAIATAFTVFGEVARAVYGDLALRRAAAIAAEAAKKRAAAKKPVRIADTIYEKLDDRNARDPHRVKALARTVHVAPGTKPMQPATAKALGAMVDAAAKQLTTRKGAPGKQQEARTAEGRTGRQTKLSIGERPLDMAKQRKGRHGGKRETKK